MEKKVIATTIGILAAFVALMTVLLVRIAPVTIKRATFSFQVQTNSPKNHLLSRLNRQASSAKSPQGTFALS